jgi:hypothetical protein
VLEDPVVDVTISPPWAMSGAGTMKVIFVSPTMIGAKRPDRRPPCEQRM